MYNANPNYEMNFMILKDVNEHMEGLFQRFSKLLPFRIDFAYKKGTPSFGYSCKHSMCMEIYRLLSETQTIAGRILLGNGIYTRQRTPYSFYRLPGWATLQEILSVIQATGGYLEANHGRGGVLSPVPG